MKTVLSLAVLAATTASFAVAAPAAAKAGDPIVVNDDLTIDPIIDGTLRWEHVDQDDLNLDADAVTIRMRAGAEATIHNLSFLAEAEGTLAIVDHYNDTIPGNNGYLGAEPYSVVADPQNVELNRLQASYKGQAFKVTLGRQRIILDDARFVGNVGWRQNEQTFDAVRGEAKFGPLSLDATYSISQRTIFGIDSPNEHFDGDFFLVNGTIDVKPVKLVGFAYLLDYDDRIAFSSKTFGAMATGSLPLGDAVKMDFKLRYATQQDYELNPVDYSADYINAELGVGVGGFGLKAGYEELGSDDGVAAFQTPLATAHAFNGWADLFLTTPATGLRDYFGSASAKIGDAGPFKGVGATVIYHKFESDFGSVNYGQEWDAVMTFKLGGYPFLLKYANYDAKNFGTDTEKLWLQVSFSY
ncbi:alginate export family protein [Novosphingobium malaysiense]|uniref:alginate export family protein n=1 Tax=Novosphingobium malaysiense TaxID=1348853 RepID=UPI00068F8C19|nr:alginate export family protein [Novosphingobium malaysiense]